MALEAIPGIIQASGEILITPWLSEDALWAVLPLMLILVLIHLYFGRHREEELGWNSAFSNSVSLLWVCVIVVRSLTSRYGYSGIMKGAGFPRLALVGILLAWVLLLLLFNFFHALPKRLSFAVSSSGGVYVLAYIAIAVSVGDMALDTKTIIAAVLLFAVMLAVLEMLKSVVPRSERARRSEGAKKRKNAAKKAARTRKAKNIHGKIREFLGI